MREMCVYKLKDASSWPSLSSSSRSAPSCVHIHPINTRRKNILHVAFAPTFHHNSFAWVAQSVVVVVVVFLTLSLIWTTCSTWRWTFTLAVHTTRIRTQTHSPTCLGVCFNKWYVGEHWRIIQQLQHAWVPKRHTQTFPEAQRKDGIRHQCTDHKRRRCVVVVVWVPVEYQTTTTNYACVCVCVCDAVSTIAHIRCVFQWWTSVGIVNIWWPKEDAVSVWLCVWCTTPSKNEHVSGLYVSCSISIRATRISMVSPMARIICMIRTCNDITHIRTPTPKRDVRHSLAGHCDRQRQFEPVYIHVHITYPVTFECNKLSHSRMHKPIARNQIQINCSSFVPRKNRHKVVSHSAIHRKRSHK